MKISCAFVLAVLVAVATAGPHHSGEHSGEHGHHGHSSEHGDHGHSGEHGHHEHSSEHGHHGHSGEHGDHGHSGEHGDHGHSGEHGHHKHDIMKQQTCINIDKVIQAVADGSDECAKMIEDAPKERTFSPEEIKMVEKAYKCILMTYSIRNDQGETVVANLNTAIDDLAQNTQKAEAIKAAINGCNSKDTIPKEERDALMGCVAGKLMLDKTCMPEGFTTSASAED